jgi:hypothetical protein
VECVRFHGGDVVFVRHEVDRLTQKTMLTFFISSLLAQIQPRVLFGEAMYSNNHGYFLGKRCIATVLITKNFIPMKAMNFPLSYANVFFVFCNIFVTGFPVKFGLLSTGRARQRWCRAYPGHWGNRTLPLAFRNCTNSLLIVLALNFS